MSEARSAPAGALDEAGFLHTVYDRFEAAYDLDRWHWGPATPAIDVCVGAVLVQHTSWTNVEKALANLRQAGVMSEQALATLEVGALADLVRPAGTPLTKARRLKGLIETAIAAGGLATLLALPIDELRAGLLATSGIGPETADCICLYAAKKPILVHDAYTERLIRRLGLGPGKARYGVWQAWLMDRLPGDLRLLQRFHAGVVVHCKTVCRVRPQCGECPLADMCAYVRA
jgi:endonuclease-3 related protein